LPLVGLRVTDGITENDALAGFPLASVAVMVLAPAVCPDGTIKLVLKQPELFVLMLDGFVVRVEPANVNATVW